MDKPHPATLVGDALAALPLEERAKFLRELLAHTAAGILIIEGAPKAAEAVYRLADAVVGRVD